MLTLHMEVLHKELAYDEILMKKDNQILTYYSLVNFAAKLDIQYQSL